MTIRVSFGELYVGPERLLKIQKTGILLVVILMLILTFPIVWA